jgi:hypothetical protein
MDYNKFIDTHATRYCIHYDFQDYYRAKARAKGSLTEKGTGKTIPTPNHIARAIAANVAGDTTVKSHLGGKIQQVMIADEAAFKALIGASNVAKTTKGDGKPCTFKVGIVVEGDAYLKLAKQLGLI